ncbi:glycosyltransferase involved in cell wall biosynthesis [Bradyrhizobium sp. AZCC 1588]
MRVLIASNDLTFNPSLVSAYLERGHEVTTGVSNFALRLGRYDIVHLHWPEELVGFGANCSHVGRTASALDLLEWWSERSVIVATVHNLIPHATERTDGPEARYFEAFYKKVDLICHFSNHSRLRYSQVYPTLNSCVHVVHGLNNFSHLKVFSKGVDLARDRLKLERARPVLSVVGAMRKVEELRLLRTAWSLANHRGATLILATELPWGRMRLGRRLLEKAGYHLWFRRLDNVLDVGGNVDDETLVSLVEASNAVIILRSGEHLNSGLLPLALTFGTPLVAPAYGINEETLRGTRNQLYRPGDARSLGAAISRSLDTNLEDARVENLVLSQGFGWSSILDDIWDEIAVVIKNKASRLRE